MEETQQPSVSGADAWRQAYESVAPQWQTLLQDSSPQGVRIPITISRVNQLDAARLDVEMTAMLKEQLLKIFSLMKPGWLSRYEAELDAFLQFLIWRFSIWVDKPTPGNALMNLRYRNEAATGHLRKGKVRTGLEGPGLTRSQKLWYCLIIVGGHYGWSRLQSFSAFRRWGSNEQSSWSHRAWILLQRIESCYKVASFVNLLVFLYTSRYRNIFERVLKARLIYERPHMNRSVSFEYMNRQLVWNEFSELLLLLLPLLNTLPVKKLLFSPFAKQQSSLNTDTENSCPVCSANPILIPFICIPCEHKYCYYCLTTRSSSSSSFHCLRCNAKVVAIKRSYVQVNQIMESS